MVRLTDTTFLAPQSIRNSATQRSAGDHSFGSREEQPDNEGVRTLAVDKGSVWKDITATALRSKSRLRVVFGLLSVLCA